MGVTISPLGFMEATSAIRAAMQRQDIPALLNAVTEEMIDALAFAGTPEDVHRQLEPWEGLFDLLLLYSPPNLAINPAETKANHEAMIAAFSRAHET